MANRPRSIRHRLSPATLAAGTSLDQAMVATAERQLPTIRQAAPHSSTGGPRRVSLRRNISWTLLGNVIHAVCQWGILIAIARLGSPEMVGQYALAVAIVLPIFMLANLNLNFVQVTDAADRFHPADYLSLRLVTSGVACLVVLAIAIAGRDSTAALFTLLAVGLAKAVESISEILHSQLHKQERMKAVSLAKSARGLVGIATVGLLLLVTGSLALAMWAMVAVSLLLLAKLDIPIVKLCSTSPLPRGVFTIDFQWPKMLRLAAMALPAGLAAALLAFNTNLPRYFIVHYLDSAALGLFVAAAYFIVATDLVVRSARVTALPRLSRHFAAGQRADFCRVTAYLMALGTLCTMPGLLLAWLAGGTLLDWIYGPEYRQAADVFFWLMLANVIWQSSVPTAVLLAMRKFWTLLAIRTLSAVALLIAAIVLLPEYGLLGAAWAVLAGKVVSSTGTALTAVAALLYPHAEIDVSPAKNRESFAAIKPCA